MQLVEQHIIKKQDCRFRELQHICRLSKNLYNAGLYEIRKYFFENKKFLNYYDLNNKFVKNKNIDYYKLPTKVSQQTLKILEKNFKSFFNLLKNNNKNINIPKYLDKNGYFVTIYTNQAISKTKLKQSIVKLSKTNIEIKTKVDNINQVRIVPKDNHITIEIIYTISDQIPKLNNNRYSSIDLGINNLITLTSNILSPIIINGKPVKSINQYYNKKTSGLNKKTKRFKSISLKRKNKIKDYFHKTSKYVIDYLISNQINTLVIGYNKKWKQKINIGKRNNQNFVFIPYLMLINMLKYKAKLVGINVIMIEESYTSKCSFLDREEIKKHESYLGKRIKRGLFKSSSGKIINSDVNGSLNILRKAVSNINFINEIEVCSTPSVYTVK